MASTTLTKKGQVTIPKVIRDTLGLQTGDTLEFIIIKSGEAIVRPITKKVDDIFGKLHDPARKAVSLEEIDRAIKEKLKAEIT